MTQGIYLGLITARGGSKGIVGKNIAPVGGRPLIEWMIRAAEASCLDRTIVSTDDEQIAEVARAAGAEVPFTRPAELAQDDSPHYDVVLHALDYVERAGASVEAVVLLQPTSPLCSSEDIDGAIHFLKKTGAQSLTSVCESDPHPYLTVTVGQDRRLIRFVDRPKRDMRRQEMPEVFAYNGAITITRAGYLRSSGNLTEPNPIAYEMPIERSLDIDTPWDMHVADLILRDELHAKA